MRFAVLGHDPLLLELAEAALRLEHELTWRAGDVMLHEQSLSPSSDWESLLDHSLADVVLVGQGDDPALREEQLRKLVQAAVPTLVSHPVSLDPLFLYELDVMRRDAGGILQYYHPAVVHPLVNELAAWFFSESVERRRDFGAVEQMTIDRYLANRTRTSVLEHFARDADLIAELGLTLTKVTSHAAPGQDPWPNLGAQMSGPDGLITRWFAAPARQESGGRLTIVSDRCEAELWMPDDGGPWRVSLVREGHTHCHSAEDWSPPDEAIRRVEAAAQEGLIENDWAQAAQSVEVAEGVVRSLARGRTIELFFEEHTDEASFKSGMAAVGCGLLMLGLCLMCVAGFVEDMLGLPAMRMPFPFLGQVRLWPLLVVGPLLVFLLIQTLPKVFGEREEHAPGGNSNLR